MTVTGPVMTLQVRDHDEVLEPYRTYDASADHARYLARHAQPDNTAPVLEAA